MPKEKRDFVDKGFDYFFGKLAERKESIKKREKLKEVLGFRDAEIRPTIIDKKSVVI